MTSTRHRLARVLRSPGVRRVGLPVGISAAILAHGRRFGLSVEAFWSAEFAVVLATWLAGGVPAGVFFQRGMRATGAPVDDPRRDDGAPPA